MVEESAPEGAEHTLDSQDQQQDHPRNNSQNPHLDTSGLDLQAILLALARWLDSQPRRRNKGVKEPDLFSRGSSDELRAFIFQCQIYFRACKGEFLKYTERIFFAISYLRGVTLDYFEPFINEAEAYQSFDFLEDWSAFVQKLSNLFGSYSPEDDDEDAIVAIPFPNDGKAINYFIQFAKFQNRIRWDNRALRKVVKDVILDHVCDKLRFSHKDISTFEGLKRAVMRIDNDFWKCQQEERHKFQASRTIQDYIPKAPKPVQGRLPPALESPTSINKSPRDHIQGPLTQYPSSSCTGQS